VAVLNEKIYFVGGNNSSSIHDRVDRYNPVSNTWSTVASMSTVRGRLAVAVLGGKLYAIGGNDASSTLSSVEIYDPSTDTWTAGPPLPSPAKQAAVITVSDKIYLIGGTNNSGLNLNQVLYLESGSSEWVALANMPTARHAHKVAWYQNRIWAIGGHSEAITGNVESYDPSTNSWRTEPSLISVRRYHSAWVAHESIFVAGGQISSGTYESSTQRFDIHVNSWKSFGTLPEAKVVSDSAILNGSVYIIGGHDGSVSSAKVFAADLNASLSGVFDLYRKDGNASSGVPVAEVADESIGISKLDATILKYLKPEITTQPQPIASTIFADTNASLSVSAEGKYLTYQWKRNGTALAGETNASLTITDANSTLHDGNYTVVVSNDFGGVESGEVEILINHSLLDGLIAWWKFDETSGTVAYDSSGNGHDANLTNGPAWVTGKIGGALSFDGTDDMVRTGVSGMYNQDFTWSTWIKTSHTSGAVVGVSADSWSNGGSSLYIFGGKPKIDVCNIGNKLGSLSINTNQWVHYLLTIEDSGGSSDPVKIFVNGQIDVDSQINWFGFSGQAFKLRIGHVPVHGNYYSGIIDDVRIYDRVLSNAEVQDLHQLGQ
jgi:N-acetylneuraminic acid mutarotase